MKKLDFVMQELATIGSELDTIVKAHVSEEVKREGNRERAKAGQPIMPGTQPEDYEEELQYIGEKLEQVRRYLMRTPRTPMMMQ